MKRLDIAVIFALISLFLLMLVYNTKFGAKLNIIWIHSPELDLAGPQELEYKLLGWNKLVRSTVPSKNVLNSEKLFLSGLAEYQNINSLRYEKEENMKNSIRVKTNTVDYSKPDSSVFSKNEFSKVPDNPERKVPYAGKLEKQIR